jgi:hypothetical protein
VSPKSGRRTEGWVMKRRTSDQLSVGRSGVVPKIEAHMPDARGRCRWYVARTMRKLWRAFRGRKPSLAMMIRRRRE